LQANKTERGMYFDTHCHYDFEQFDKDRDELLTRALPQFGMAGVINAGINVPASRACVALSEQYDYIYAALGFHPHNASELTEGDLEILEELAKEPKVVAIGEIGLDFHYNHSDADTQRRCFALHLDLACKVGLPVLVHCREADEEVRDILLSRDIGGKVGGVLHCFSGTAELALEYVAMGFYIGVGGVVTYKNAEGLREVVRRVPPERLLLETDSPYLSPVPKRGGRNDSRNLVYVAEQIGAILGASADDVAMMTVQNARRLFGIART